MSGFMSSDPETQEMDKQLPDKKEPQKNAMTNLMLSFDAATGQVFLGSNDKVENLPEDIQKRMLE